MRPIASVIIFAFLIANASGSEKVLMSWDQDNHSICINSEDEDSFDATLFVGTPHESNGVNMCGPSIIRRYYNQTTAVLQLPESATGMRAILVLRKVSEWEELAIALGSGVVYYNSSDPEMETIDFA